MAHTKAAIMLCAVSILGAALSSIDEARAYYVNCSGAVSAHCKPPAKDFCGQWVTCIFGSAVKSYCASVQCKPPTSPLGKNTRQNQQQFRWIPLQPFKK